MELVKCPICKTILCTESMRQDGAAELQQVCAEALQELALSAVGEAALKADSRAMGALRELRSAGLTSASRQCAAGALFKLEGGSKGQDGSRGWVGWGGVGGEEARDGVVSVGASAGGAACCGGAAEPGVRCVGGRAADVGFDG